MSDGPEPIRARCGIVGQMLAMYHQEFGVPEEPDPSFTITTTNNTNEDLEWVNYEPTTADFVNVTGTGEPVVVDGSTMVNPGAWIERLANELAAGGSMRPNDPNGSFEASSPLRDESEPLDAMGADYDPGVPGIAESWFRKLRG